MSDPRHIWDGFTFMVVGVVVAGLLIVTVGTTIDEVLFHAVDSGLLDVPATWNFFGSILMLKNLFYVIVYALMIMAVVVFIISATQRQRYDRYDRYNPPRGGGF